MNKLIYTSLILLTIFTTAYSQTKTLTGVVTEQNGDPLIGATIVALEAGGKTHSGTISGIDGSFSMDIPAAINSILVSYVGYETKTIDITNVNQIDIILSPSALGLEEVVVTALGIKKEKKALGYAFSDVKGEDLTTNRDVNFINSISNKVAGVNISQTAGGAGTSSRIIIRGVKSLSTESQPLIVVDGVPMDNTADGATWLGGLDYGNSLMGISPDDIETVSILKGPNAAALYGSRAAMGVIMITTKKGSGKEQLKVTINSNFMFERAYLHADYQNEYGAGFGGGIQYQALTPTQQELYGRDSAYFYYSTGSWGPELDGSFEVLNWNGEFTKMVPQPDNVKDYFEHGFTATNSVSIENGTERSNWRFSASSLNNSGLKPNSTYDRNSVNFNINSKLNEFASFSFKSNYIREDAFNRVGQGDSRTGARTFVWMPRSIDTNKLRTDYKNENGYEQNWYFSDDWHTNPYWEAYENYNNDNKNQFTGFAKIDLNFTPWLKGFIRSSMDTYISKRYLRVANNALRANGEGSFTEQWINYRSLNHDFLLTAEKTIGDDLQINANLGGNYYNYFVDYQSSTINGLAVPNFFTLNNAKYPAESSMGSTKREKVIQSFYGSTQLSYKTWLFLELTARNDWTSALAPENNSYLYPSVNTSFVFSEAFNLTNKYFSFGKIRLSLAEVGNDTDPYKLSRAFINQKYGLVPAIYLSGEGSNPNLRSESTISKEIGADLRFFENRLGLDITYYNELSYDQIFKAEISKASGYSSIITNGGEISNSGIEIQFNAKPIKSTNFNWDISANYAKNNNMVKSLAEGLAQFTITDESQIIIVAIPGRPFGEIIGNRLARYYEKDIDGNIVDNPNNGKPLIDENGFYVMDERGVIGNITPDWSGGITNNLRYKNLSLSFSVGFSVGGEMFSKTNKYGKDNGQFEETLEGRESWYNATTDERFMGRMGLYNADGTPMLDADENQMFDAVSEPVGYVPDGVLADGTINTKGIDPQVYWHQRKWGGIAELDVYDASYVKLRDVTINYQFPSKWFANNFFQSGSFSIIGKNLWLIYSGVPHIDPESSFSSNNNGLGQEYAAMPTTRSVGFNVRLVF
ncbi:MAG: SusC/RagA family TonB-linked outer membrane protein [Bacteroidales bacterium]|nr:SusC/RagA family TonB-linked outer membrane protein [Bacteroidales bacterium]MCF8391144.1 SusC/RagA family TonB-linked outer membrane protein [Bacteroidales bacterium]